MLIFTAAEFLRSAGVIALAFFLAGAIAGYWLAATHHDHKRGHR